MTKPFNVRSAALKHGWRSGLEESVASFLKAEHIPFEYESITLPYIYPEKTKRYTPDFIFANGIIVETKGRLVTSDREKLKLIKQQYPDLDLRMVFSNPNQRISKQSSTTYAKWATTLGIPYAKRDIPTAWLLEPLNDKSLKVIAHLRSLPLNTAKKSKTQ